MTRPRLVRQRVCIGIGVMLALGQTPASSATTAQAKGSKF